MFVFIAVVDRSMAIGRTKPKRAGLLDVPLFRGLAVPGKRVY